MPQTCCADSCSIALSTFNVNLYFQTQCRCLSFKSCSYAVGAPKQRAYAYTQQTHMSAHTHIHTHTRTHLIPCILLKTFTTNSAVTNITPHSTAWNLYEIYFTLTLCACSRDWKLSELCLSILSRLMCLRCENAEIPTLLTVL